MRLHRFYIEEKLKGKERITIGDEALLHQLKDVFRLKAGDSVIFFDGEGLDITFSIELISKKEGVFEKKSETKSFVPKTKVTLLMSVIKKENFELVVEKATEIGASEIVPIITERTLQKNLNTDRLQKIIIEASEQCGRGDVPILRNSLDLEAVLEKNQNIIAFDISGASLSTERISEVLGSSHQTIGNSFAPETFLLIGPEGGWSEKELALFKSKNIPLYKLGSTTLRAETAAIVASAFFLI